MGLKELWRSLWGEDTDSTPSKGYDTIGNFEGHEVGRNFNVIGSPEAAKIHEDFEAHIDDYHTERLPDSERHMELVDPNIVEGVHMRGTRPAEGFFSRGRDEAVIDDPNVFWNMHGHSHDEYLELTSHIPEVNAQIAGKSPEEQTQILRDLRDDPELGPCVTQCYMPSNGVKAWELGDIYEFDGDGRHRILAARENMENARSLAEQNGESFDESKYYMPVQVVGSYVPSQWNAYEDEKEHSAESNEWQGYENELGNSNGAANLWTNSHDEGIHQENPTEWQGYERSASGIGPKEWQGYEADEHEQQNPAQARVEYFGQRYRTDDEGKLYSKYNPETKEWELMPDTKYKLDGYFYETDNDADIVRAGGTLRENEDGRKPLNASVRDQRENDDRGHIIGDQFDASNREGNLVAQDSTINRGEYKAFEGELASKVADGHDVQAIYDLDYPEGSHRPEQIGVRTYTDENDYDERAFSNERSDDPSSSVSKDTERTPQAAYENKNDGSQSNDNNAEQSNSEDYSISM